MQMQTQENTRVNYHNANANASAYARNGKTFIFSHLHLRLRLHFTLRTGLTQTQMQTQGKKNTGSMPTRPGTACVVRHLGETLQLRLRILSRIQTCNFYVTIFLWQIYLHVPAWHNK